MEKRLICREGNNPSFSGTRSYQKRELVLQDSYSIKKKNGSQES